MDLSSALTYGMAVLAVLGLFFTIIGVFVIFHIFRPQKSPADTSNRINKIRLFWFVLTREELFVNTFPWLKNDELDNMRSFQSNVFISEHEQYKATYNAWCDMNLSCAAPSHHDYALAGAKGAFVHPAWVNNFEQFVEDMGFKSSPDQYLARRDLEQPFVPGNAVWWPE